MIKTYLYHNKILNKNQISLIDTKSTSGQMLECMHE